jgi:hypothetical protein
MNSLGEALAFGNSLGGGICWSAQPPRQGTDLRPSAGADGAADDGVLNMIVS